MNLPLRARVYFWVVIASAVATLAALVYGAARTITPPAAQAIVLAELVVLVVFAQHFPLTYGPTRKFDLSIAVHAAFLFLALAPLAVVLTAGGEAIGQGTLMLRRDRANGRRMRGAYGAAFNTAQLVLAQAVASLVYRGLLLHVATPLALVAGAACLYLINTSLVAVMAALHQGKPLLAVWLDGRPWSAAQSGSLMVLGLVMAQSARHEPWVPLLMVVPAALTYASLQRTARAEAAILARDEFLSLASHELRTPLTSLRGYAQLLRERFRRSEDFAAIPGAEYVPRAIETIDRQSLRLCALIDQLLDVSRVQSGKLELERERFDLAAMTRDVAASLQLIIPDYKIVVSAPDSVMVDADRMRLEQVLTNLITNAARHAGGGERIDVEVAQAGSKVSLAIQDYGVGVPAAHRDQIFDRYYQAQQRRVAGGLGVGLYISRQIVERHGGRISLESPAGGGARFVLTIPAAIAPSATAEGPTRGVTLVGRAA